MALDDVLNRLEGVRQTAADRWIARCPAHDDKHPSLHFRVCDDGRILMKCRAECENYDILGCIGLKFDSLFPEKVIEGAKRFRNAFPASDVLRCLGYETGIIAVVAWSLRDGVPLTEDDYERLKVATSRIQAAVEACNA